MLERKTVSNTLRTVNQKDGRLMEAGPVCSYIEQTPACDKMLCLEAPTVSQVSCHPESLGTVNCFYLFTRQALYGTGPLYNREVSSYRMKAIHLFQGFMLRRDYQSRSLPPSVFDGLHQVQWSCHYSPSATTPHISFQRFTTLISKEHHGPYVTRMTSNMSEK